MRFDRDNVVFGLLQLYVQKRELSLRQVSDVI